MFVKIQERYLLPTVFTTVIAISTIFYFVLIGVDGNDHEVTSHNPWNNFPKIETLAPIRSITNPDEKLLFIGDVHGNYDELIQLLEEKHYYHDGHLIKPESAAEEYKIILLGDFLTKGPDSLKVADFILNNKDQVDCVLGNNEIMVLLSLLNPHPEMRIPLRFSTDNDFFPDKEDDYVDVITPRKRHARLARKLGVLKLSQLAQHCSVVKKYDMTLSGDVFFGVHAGLLPGDFKPDSKGSDLSPVGNMYERIPSIISVVDMKYVNSKDWTETGREVSSVKNGIRWYKLWDHYYRDNSINNQVKNVTVLYGHDAHHGLTLRDHTKGLDSACAKGGHLSSLEYTFDPASGHYKAELYQVPCHRM